MRLRSLVVILLCGPLLVLAAQTEEPEPSPAEPAPIVSTVTVGGLVTGVSGYGFASYGWYRGRLGYVGEVFTEIAYRNWPDGVGDRFFYLGGSAGIRYSALPGGRGIFAELNLAGGNAWLTTIDGTSRERVSDFNFGAAPRLGIRFGNERGFYGEAGGRVLLSFREILLTTNPPAPSDEPDQEISRNLWYLPDVMPITRFSLGIGYTF